MKKAYIGAAKRARRYLKAQHYQQAKVLFNHLRDFESSCVGYVDNPLFIIGKNLIFGAPIIVCSRNW